MTSASPSGPEAEPAGTWRRIPRDVFMRGRGTQRALCFSAVPPNHGAAYVRLPGSM